MSLLTGLFASLLLVVGVLYVMQGTLFHSSDSRQIYSKQFVGEQETETSSQTESYENTSDEIQVDAPANILTEKDVIFGGASTPKKSVSDTSSEQSLSGDASADALSTSSVSDSPAQTTENSPETERSMLIKSAAQTTENQDGTPSQPTSDSNVEDNSLLQIQGFSTDVNAQASSENETSSSSFSSSSTADLGGTF